MCYSLRTLLNVLAVHGVLVIYLPVTAQLHAQTGLPGTGQRPPLVNFGNLPEDWNPGKFNRRTGKWLSETARNIKWIANLGSQTFGAPVVAGGKVFVGTNNTNGYLKRYPGDGPLAVDLGALIAIDEQTGEFLWQHSSEKLPTGRVNDWPLQGIQSSPWVEGERAWFVSNRGEVICLDTRGFEDQEDDGEKFEESSILSLRRDNEDEAALIADLDRHQLPAPLGRFIAERWTFKPAEYRVEVVKPGHAWRVVSPANAALSSFSVTRDFWGLRVARDNAQPDPHEADVVWRLDMMQKLGARQHNNSTCCVTVWKETLFVCTGNGVDESHIEIPAPEAPSFAALNKTTGKVLWTSNLPGKNIHHGNWSSPAVGMLGGVPQVIFNGGDGWTYSFHAEEYRAGQPTLLWKFDTNAKEANLELGGRGTRNEPIGVPVLHENRVYITTGQDAEHGEGPGCIWCLDPTRRGDVSAELAVLRADPKTIVPHDRIQAVQPEKGHMAIANPNSAVVWKFAGHDLNTDGELEPKEQMHRTLSPVVITGDLLFANDFSGVVHCLDRKTGRLHWTYDTLAAIWSPPLVADGKVYIADEDGDIAIFQASADPVVAGKRPPTAEAADRPAQIDPVREINMLNSCYTLPTASNGVLFIASKDHLFAIEVKRPTP
jgi:outer membrane protein assembly factor BamB